VSHAEEKEAAERAVTPPPARPPAREEGAAEPEQAPPTGLKYVFKIAPADPKNSFDFEDVADK
jgi:hypothetical protein